MRKADMVTSGAAQVPGQGNDGGARWRRAIPLVLALLLTLIVLGIIGGRTAHAIAEAHRRNQLRPGAATSVRPWMSLEYVAANYGVTQPDLLAALNLTDTPPHRRAPLEVIAMREGRDLNADITVINTLIAERGTPHTAPERPALPFMPGGTRGTPGMPGSPRTPVTGP
jgi:hypothetical protein